MSNPDELLALLDSVTALLADATTHASDATLQQIFERCSSHLDTLRDLESLVTRALDEYKLHPSLLFLRAKIRIAITYAELSLKPGELTIAISDGAVADLDLAGRLAPGFFEPQLELAAYRLNIADDAASAEQRLRELVPRMQRQLCDGVGGWIEALAEIDPATVEVELAQWRTRFPDSKRLADAAARLDHQRAAGSTSR